MVSVSGTEDEAATRRKFWASGLAGGGLTYHHGAGWYWISTTRSHPAASISLARVGSDGWRSPASYALITLCATPALKASSACDIPAPARARRSRLPAVSSARPTKLIIADC